MKLHSKYIAICLFLISNCLFSQQDKVTKANTKYFNMSYVDAIKLYTNLVNDGYGTSEIFENLGNSYYFQSNYEFAKASYDSLYNKTHDFSIPTYYRYINVLRSVNNNKKANDIYAKLLVKYPQEKRATTLKNSITVNPITLPVAHIELMNSNVNSQYSDYKVSYLGDEKIVFSSGRATKNISVKRSIWNNEAYTNLYESNLDFDSTKVVVKKLKGKVNKFYNESSAVFTKDGTTMYFTRNNQLKAAVKTDSLDNMLLKIYKATYNGKRWGSIEELPFNSNQYNCAHPTLSPDEDYLYFSSDMPGTNGGSDLCRVAINDVSYGEPENLGKTINTTGRDTFPYITSNNVLIFSSDFRKGLGGLDLYYVDLNSNSKRVYTFSQPINSSFDDFGLIYKVSEGTGFLTSNREEDNKGSDDIYAFSNFSIPKLKDVTIGIKSSRETEVLGKTILTLFNTENMLIGTVEVTNNQVSLLDINPLKSYNVQVSNKQFEDYSSLITFKEGNSKTINLIEKAPDPISIDLNDVLKLKTIYFSFDKATVSRESEIELEKVLTILNTYPEIKLDIIGHTDSRGPSDYNDKLSNQRAASTKQWLVNKGVSIARLNSYGFGEKKLVNDCKEAKKCTKTDHDQNRRTEFLIQQ